MNEKLPVIVLSGFLQGGLCRSNLVQVARGQFTKLSVVISIRHIFHSGLLSWGRRADFVVGNALARNGRPKASPSLAANRRHR